jgi:hypothetical protein
MSRNISGPSIPGAGIAPEEALWLTGPEFDDIMIY